MPSKNVLIVRRVCLVCLLCTGFVSTALGQDHETEFRQLLKQVTSKDFATRNKAAANLISMGEKAITPLIQFLENEKLDLESVARCGDVLVQIAKKIKPSSEAGKSLLARTRELIDSNDPKLVGIAKRINSNWPKDPEPSFDEVRQAFRDAGCRIRKSSGAVEINLTHDFTGTAETLRLARYFKKDIELGIHITLDLAFFEVLPELTIRKLGIGPFSSKPVDLEKEQVVEKLQEIAKCKQIRELGLSFSGFPKEELKMLRNFPELARLYLPASTTDEELKFLAEVPKLYKIGFRNPPGIKGHGLAFLKKNKELRIVDLSSFVKTDHSFKSLSELTQITHLTLPQHSTNETLESIPALTNLKYLGIKTSFVTDEGMKHLVGLTNLDYLVVGDTPITQKSIPHINANPNLSRILMWETLITQDEAKGLRLPIDSCRFSFKPADKKQKQIVLDLIESGVIVRPLYQDSGYFDVSIRSPRVASDFDAYSKIAQLNLRSIFIDHALSEAQATELCKQRIPVNIFLLGNEIKDSVAELFHKRFKYVVDYRNGKKRVTNKWKRAKN